MNRLKEYFERSPREPEGDFWVVRGACGWYRVSRQTARELEEQLDRADVPTWLTFTDSAGSHVRIRSAQVAAVFESTAAQRSLERAVDRLIEQEEKAEKRPWEDD